MAGIPGLEGAERALAVAAHPDDLDFGCAGTLAAMVEAGIDVTEVIFTRGDAGSNDPAAKREELAEVRTREAQAAAAAIGCAVELLDFPDGDVLLDRALRLAMARAIRRHRPKVLMTVKADPLIGRHFINHPDHRAVGQAALDACVTGASTRLMFPELLREGLEPWKPSKVLLFGPPDGSEEFAVDVSAVIDRKVAALQAHASQIDAGGAEARVKAWAAEQGRTAGFAYAESFHAFEVFP